MKTLTDNQKEFLLTYFFENEKYAGWRNIAEVLLTKGKCIVAGTECIWHGGIGNFIKTEPAKDAIGCLVYKFDLNYFLTSAWYKEVHENYIIELAGKVVKQEEYLNEAKAEYNEICNL